MTVSGAEFTQWLAAHDISVSYSELSRLAGVNRVTVANQVRRGSVAETTIVGIARGVGIDPIEALKAFTDYEDLDNRPRQPTLAEVLSQIHLMDLMEEARFRTGEVQGERTVSLEDFPHRGSQKAWLDAIGTAGFTKRIAEASGMAPNYISAMSSANKLTPAVAVTASRLSGGSLISGLVVTGLLIPAEGGWAPDIRHKALIKVHEFDLLGIIQHRLSRLQKYFKAGGELSEDHDHEMGK